MIKDYPLHIDIFALCIFLGTIQGIFLSYFFLYKINRQVKANVFLGFLLITSSLLCFDILFSYTNFMFQVIYLVDATDPLNFLIGPLFYLYIIAKVDESKLKKVYFHFIPSLKVSIYINEILNLKIIQKIMKKIWIIILFILLVIPFLSITISWSQYVFASYWYVEVRFHNILQ